MKCRGTYNDVVKGFTGLHSVPFSPGSRHLLLNFLSRA